MFSFGILKFELNKLWSQILKHLLFCLGLVVLAACQSSHTQAPLMKVAHKDLSFQISEQALLEEFQTALKSRVKVLPKKRPNFSITVELLDSDQPSTWLLSESGFVTQPKSSDIYRISFKSARLLQNSQSQNQ